METSDIQSSGLRAVDTVIGGTPVCRQALIVVALLLPGAQGQAQSDGLDDASTACREAATMAESNDIDGAIEEARWCLEVLEQHRRDAAFAVFPDSQGDWIGGDLDNQSALGMMVLSRTYANGGQSIEVSVTTGPAGGGLAALAQLGASLGASLGAGESSKFRVQRRTVVDLSGDGEAVNYMIELRSGGVMTIQSSDTGTSDVRAFIEAFPVADIDDALKR